MGLFNNFLGRLGLQTHDRETIFRAFGSFVANRFGQNTGALLQNGYESNTDVYAVIKKTVETLKAVPTVIERRTSEGWEIIEDTSIHELMAMPNASKGYTWDDIEEQRAIYLLADGDSYMVGNTQFNSTRIEEVDILPNQATTIKTNQDFFMPNIRYDFAVGSTKRIFSNDEVQHVKFFNPNYSTVDQMFNGLSMVQVAALAVQVGNDRWEADANLLQNRGAIGLLSNQSDRPMTEPEAMAMQSAFDRSTAGPRNFGKVKVTSRDMKFVQMAMSSADLQIIEKGVVTLRTICNVFGLDSSLFNDPANKTFNNRKEAEKALYTNVVMPLAKKIDAADTMFIAKNHFPDGSVRIRKDFSRVEVLQQDKQIEAVKNKVVSEGVGVVVNMEISSEGKRALLRESYGFSNELLDLIVTPEIDPSIVDNIDPLAITSEAVNENAEAQARLRGSVGGVQGILAIQQGVADGVTAPSAAISTMIEIYGFDEATARRVLGL